MSNLRIAHVTLSILGVKGHRDVAGPLVLFIISQESPLEDALRALITNGQTLEWGVIIMEPGSDCLTSTPGLVSD